MAKYGQREAKSLTDEDYDRLMKEGDRILHLYGEIPRSLTRQKPNSPLGPSTEQYASPLGGLTKNGVLVRIGPSSICRMH